MDYNRKLSITPFITIGLLVGLSLALLSYFNVDKSLPYVWISFFGIMFLLAFTTNDGLFKLTLSSLGFSFLAATPFFWLNSSSPTAILLPLINAYALNSFHIAWQKEGVKFQYPTLFYAVWDTFPKGFVTLFFTGLCLMVLQIWGLMFKLIGVDFFLYLFTRTWFVIASSALFAAIGLHISQQAAAVIRNLRYLLLKICQWLLPVMSFIGVLFIVSWLIVVAFSGKSSLNPHLLSLYSAFFIIFLNGVYQEGDIDKPYIKTLSRIVHLSVVILPVFMLIVLYTLIFSVSDLSYMASLYQLNTVSLVGLNNFNFTFLLNTVILFFYSIVYAYIVIRRRTIWHRSLGQFNIVIAYTLIAVTLLSNNYFFYHASFNPGKVETVYRSAKMDAKQLAEKQYRELSTLLAASPVNWQAASSKPLVLVRQGQDNHSVCRSLINNRYAPGLLANNQCVVFTKNTIKQVSNYQLLAGDDKQLVWKNWFNLYNLARNKGLIPVLLTLNDNGLNAVCRTIYRNQLYVGIFSSKDSQCRIIIDNAEINSKALQYLYVKQ